MRLTIDFNPKDIADLLELRKNNIKLREQNEELKLTIGAFRERANSDYQNNLGLHNRIGALKSELENAHARLAKLTMPKEQKRRGPAPGFKHKAKESLAAIPNKTLKATKVA